MIKYYKNVAWSFDYNRFSFVFNTNFNLKYHQVV